MKFETNLSRYVQQLENGSNKDSHFVATKKTTYKQHCNVPSKVTLYALGSLLGWLWIMCAYSFTSLRIPGGGGTPLILDKQNPQENKFAVCTRVRWSYNKLFVNSDQL